MRTIKLTFLGKLVVFLVIVAIVCVPTYLMGGFNGVGGYFSKLTSSGKAGTTEASRQAFDQKDSTGSSNTINLSLDEWIGWKSVIDANGGLETKKGSIYEKMGIRVNIKVIDDATISSNSLIKGDLNAAGYTVNRYAFLYEKFKSAGIPVAMTYITNSSTGGDGIISKQGINRVEDLVGKKVAIPRFSEAQTLIEWLMSKSSLTPEQIDSIRKQAVFFDTPDDAAKAFFGGKVDAAATWQPYLSQAQETTGAKLLFSTKAATNIILDGIVFRRDYLEKNSDTVQKFIEGSLEAESTYKSDLNAIKEMPLFTTETSENILKMTNDATLANVTTNKELLGGIAQNLFVDMSGIWSKIGEKTDPRNVQDAFDSKIITALADKNTAVEAPQTPKFTEKQREAAKAQDNMQALLKTTLTVNFEPNLAVIKDDSHESLDKFAEIAKILNGAIIQIEGNVSKEGVPMPEYDQMLSTERAKAVATYLQVQGLDPARFVVIGNGTTKQIADNNTQEGRIKNRRTDIFFKIIE